ncbi:MAG: hypothetical protein V1703_01385, partial [Candidatus Altiarchaeota archaeon]
AVARGVLKDATLLGFGAVAAGCGGKTVTKTTLGTVDECNIELPHKSTTGREIKGAGFDYPFGRITFVGGIITGPVEEVTGLSTGSVRGIFIVDPRASNETQYAGLTDAERSSVGKEFLRLRAEFVAAERVVGNGNVKLRLQEGAGLPVVSKDTKEKLEKLKSGVAIVVEVDPANLTFSK